MRRLQAADGPHAVRRGGSFEGCRLILAASRAVCKATSPSPLAVRHLTRLAAETEPGWPPAGEPDGTGQARLALCKAILVAEGPLRLRIRGSSMVPALWPGESVTICSTAMKDARVGQTAVFLRDGHFVAHRIVRIAPSKSAADRRAVVTRGDAAREEDAPILQSEWLGIVASVHRFGRPRALRHVSTRFAMWIATLVRDSILLRRVLDRLGVLAGEASAVQGRSHTDPATFPGTGTNEHQGNDEIR